MKNLMNYLTAALFFSLVAFASCGGSDDDDGAPEEDLLADKAALLVRGTATLDEVVIPTGATATLDWSAFAITYTGGKDGGSYTTSGVPDGGEGVWPASGTWTFNGTTGTKITRDGSVDIDIALSAESDALEMSFNIPAPAAARTSVIAGAWTFKMLFAAQ